MSDDPQGDREAIAAIETIGAIAANIGFDRMLAAVVAVARWEAESTSKRAAEDEAFALGAAFEIVETRLRRIKEKAEPFLREEGKPLPPEILAIFKRR